ncbi:MAG: metallophosphoesterase [Deltaproteobacteria bacterium]|nr:metallophosphoesterase [Deltaproteobacteria bacterium]
MLCFFASDLHAREDRYRKLWDAVRAERPEVVLLGGDLLPSAMHALTSGCLAQEEFLATWLSGELSLLRSELGSAFPRVLVIPGNDDGRFEEAAFLEAERKGVLEYIAVRKVMLGGTPLYGYPYVPPTPFRLKDWERYDVSRFVDPGCVPPEDGLHSQPFVDQPPFPTIQEDLAQLVGTDDLSRAVFLFHCPPYQSKLDRAALDGKMFDHCPLDVHVGSIAIRRLIETYQPLLTLHGHVHESARLTGSWRETIGRTICLSAAHDGPELALVSFELGDPGNASRRLL